MKIYLAGGVSGNLKPFWKIVSAKLREGLEYREAFDFAMQVFLAGTESRRWILEGYADLSRGNERHSQNSRTPVRTGGVR